MPQTLARITPLITVDERIVYRMKAVGPGSVSPSADGPHAEVAGRIDGAVTVAVPLHARSLPPSPSSSASDAPPGSPSKSPSKSPAEGRRSRATAKDVSAEPGSLGDLDADPATGAARDGAPVPSLGPVDQAAVRTIARAAAGHLTFGQRLGRLARGLAGGLAGGPAGRDGTDRSEASDLRVGWIVPQTIGTGKANDPRLAAAEAIGLEGTGAAPIDVRVPAGAGDAADNTVLQRVRSWTVERFDPRQLEISVHTSIVRGRVEADAETPARATGSVAGPAKGSSAPEAPRTRDDRLCVEVRVGRRSGPGDSRKADHGWAVTRVAVDWPSRRHDPVGTARLRVAGRTTPSAGEPPLGLLKQAASRSDERAGARSVVWRPEPKRLRRDPSTGMATATIMLPLDAFGETFGETCGETFDGAFGHAFDQTSNAAAAHDPPVPRVAMELVPVELEDRCVSGASFRAIDAAGRTLPRSIVRHRSTVDIEFGIDLPAVARDRPLPVRRRLSLEGLVPSGDMLARIDHALAGAGMHLDHRDVVVTGATGRKRSLASNAREATASVIARDAFRHLAPCERLSVVGQGMWTVADFTTRDVRVEVIVEAANSAPVRSAAPVADRTAPLQRLAVVLEARHPDPEATGRALEAIIETVHDRLAGTAGGTS
ncbi:MAG: hypothetical protein AB8G96_16410 [Phycisphaerales bacterium]